MIDIGSRVSLLSWCPYRREQKAVTLRGNDRAGCKAGRLNCL